MDAKVTVTTLSRAFPDGQRVVGLLLEYPQAVRGWDLEPEMFAVENRTVTNVYVPACRPSAACVLPEGAYEGTLVIVQLDPDDDAAPTLTDMGGQPLNLNRPKGGGGGPRGAAAGGPGGFQGGDSQGNRNDGPQGGGPMRSFTLPDGRTWRGPHGLSHRRPPLKVQVMQVAPVLTAAGGTLAAWDAPCTNTAEVNEWSDLFTEDSLNGMPYNLFIPEELDPQQRYPLVVFIEDASCLGPDARIALEQGLGGVVWASPEEQAKHPCFVLAVQDVNELPFTNDDYWATDDLETVKDICDDLLKRYPIDQDRIYVTGQSMGFMSTVELMSRYPDYFAAGLPVAGHWDLERTSALWNNNVWMFLSDEDRGGNAMYALPEWIAWRGGTMSRYEWDADQPLDALDALARTAAADDATTFKLTVFPNDSIWRTSQPDRTLGGGHFGTWHLVYQIEGVRDWLFKQERNAKG